MINLKLILFVLLMYCPVSTVAGDLLGDTMKADNINTVNAATSSFS